MTPAEVAELPQGRFCQQGLVNLIAFTAFLMGGSSCLGLAVAPGWEKLGPIFGIVAAIALFRARRSIFFVDVCRGRLRTRSFPESNWVAIDEHTTFRSLGGIPMVKRGRHRFQMLALSGYYGPFGKNTLEFDDLIQKLDL